MTSNLEGHRPDRIDDPVSAQWLTGLANADVTTQARLHDLLLRAAYSEVRRRATGSRIAGPELDDLAHQAADDAMVSIVRKLSTFRGESRFTTWAYKFVIFEVASKVARHMWTDPVVVVPDEQWERLPDHFGLSPELAVQATDLLSAIRDVVETELTERQRSVFRALVLDAVPLDELVARTGSSRGAIYKTLFDARRKIRLCLVTKGYLGDGEVQ